MNHPGTGPCNVCGKCCYLTEYGFLCAQHEPEDEVETEMYEYVCECKDVSIEFEDSPDRKHRLACPFCGAEMEEA